MRTSPAPALRRLRCLSRVIAKHSHAWARYSCAVQHFPATRALQRFDASVIVLAQMKMVQSWIALACLLAGADAFGPMPHHTHEEPDTHEVPHHTHESESPPPSASPSPPPSAPVIVPKFKEHQGFCATSPSLKGDVIVTTENADECWDACEKEAGEEIASGTTKAASTHVFRVTDAGAGLVRTTECQCQMGCDCWKAPDGADLAAGSMTTLAKPDWEPPLAQCSSPPTAPPSPALPAAKFSEHDGFCAAVSAKVPIGSKDSAEECWDACALFPGFAAEPNHKYRKDTPGEYTSDCECSSGCTCWVGSADADPVKPTFITLAKLAWNPPEVYDVDSEGNDCPEMYQDAPLEV